MSGRLGDLSHQTAKLSTTVAVSRDLLDDMLRDTPANVCGPGFEGGHLLFQRPCFIHTRYSERCSEASRFISDMGDAIDAAIVGGYRNWGESSDVSV